MNNNQDYLKQNRIPDCRHQFLPLGFEKISTDETKIEVVTGIVCSICGMFRTKILYFDRQKDINQNKISQNNT